MAGKDVIFGRLFKLRATNQDIVELEDNGADGAGPTLQLRDDQFYIVDPTDTSKRMRFDVGALATATTLVLPGTGRVGIHPSADGLTLTAALSGKTMLFDAAGATAYVLPAIAAADVGITYDFFTTVTATGNHTITAAAGDLLVGTAFLAVTGADVEVFHPDATDDLIITQNGTTSGGIAGSWVRLTALSATRWGVVAVLNASGVQITPFS